MPLACHTGWWYSESLQVEIVLKMIATRQDIMLSCLTRCGFLSAISKFPKSCSYLIIASRPLAKCRTQNVIRENDMQCLGKLDIDEIITASDISCFFGHAGLGAILSFIQSV